LASFEKDYTGMDGQQNTKTREEKETSVKETFISVCPFCFVY